jgi:hypothetical protein
MLKRKEINYLKNISHSLMIFLLAFGLTACTPSTEDPFSEFNKEYGPEYQLNKTHLFVNWQGSAQQKIAPLKLKIPLPYLMNSVGAKGEIKTITWALEPMKNGNIDTIYLALRRSNGQPVPYVSPDKTDDPEITKKQNEIFSDEYVVKIFRDIKGDVLNRDRDCCSRSDSELFRGRDQAGLEQYVEMRCYDVQELQEKVKHLSEQHDSKDIMQKLANKPSYDITPSNCLAVRDTYFWRSPINTPPAMAVKIDSSLGFAGYRINLLYKNHLVVAYPREISEELAKKSSFYHQQITQLLDSMAVQ